MNHVESDSVNAAARWRLTARILAVFIVFIMVSTAFAAFLASAEDTPGIWTSRDEYSPGEIVEIYGGGFVKWVPVTITISHPDIATQTFAATPDMYGRFVCNDYVAELVNSYNVSVTVTATQILATGNRVATTHFWDPAAFLEGWTLMPNQRFTTGDVKGYNEGDSVPMIVVLNKRQLHANAVTMSIGVDYIDTTPLHVPTYGIDYLTQYWVNPPTAPFNTYASSSSPFFVASSAGALSNVHRDSDIYDAGTHITEQVWTFTFTFSSSASTATVRFGAHLAVSDIPNNVFGASYYPGESLHVRIVAMSPDVNNGNRDVPISLGQLLGPPEMTLEKECDPEIVVQGDIITFTAHFSNIGEAYASCVNLWDNLPGPGVVSLIPGSFLYWDTYDPTPMTPVPGPTIMSDGWTWFIGEFSGTGSPCSPRPVNDAYVSFQAVIVTSQEGTYRNWVHLSFQDSHGGMFPQLDAYCDFTILGYPSISIIKSGPAYAHVGDTVTYTYTVTNTGNVNLVSVDVVDNVAGNVQLGLSLLAHQSVTLTKTYTIQPGDPHFLTNSVTATGTDTHGRIVIANSQWTLEIFRPYIEITKTSDLSCAKVGEGVWYTISWSNPPQWETTLYNVTVYDPMLMAVPIAVGTLPPGGSGQISIRYTITGQWGDPQINTATAKGEDIIHGAAMSSASVRLDVVHPAVEIMKTANKACAAVGEMVIYTITVTNPATADVWLNGTYGDTQLNEQWTFENLRPGQSLQQVLAWPMPDMDEFINHAWVSAQDHQLHVVSGSAAVRVDVVHPAVQITKTADKACAAVGETVQFTITVTNPVTADVWLNGTVSDPMIGKDWSFTNLMPGQHVVFTAFYQMPADMDDFINTAGVVAYDHQQHAVRDSASVRVDIVHPAVEITKTASLPCAGVGEDVTFTITVTNPASADVWLNGTVADPMLQESWAFSDLMPGSTFVQTVTIPMPAGFDDFVNTATVDAFDHQNHEVTGSASVRVDIVHPAVTITKTADKACAAVGENVTFDIIVTNPASADVWLNGTLTDQMLQQSWPFADLMPGQTFELKVTMQMPAGADDFVNTATVDAFDHQRHEVTGSASVRVDIVHPAVTITKTADKACAAVGEPVVFTITVTNPGSADVWLNGTVVDPMIGGSWDFANLRPGEQFIVNAPYPMPKGPTDFINIASVVATDHQGHAVYAESVPLRIDIVHPAVEITKVADQKCAGVGEPVTFTITVTNPASADVWLNGTVSDPMLAKLWSFFDLMPGQTYQQIVTIPMPAGADDFVNTATVDAFDHQQHEVTGSASVRVDIVHPDVQITKTSDLQCAGVGETVFYTITVTNPASSDVWLNGTYGDEQLGVSWSFQDLMPGQSLSQIVQAAMPDVDAFYNAAWVVASDHQGHEVANRTSIRVDVVHPDITISKTADRIWAHDGDLITYTITVGVPATADVWMNGTVSDPMLGFAESFFDLMPGQSISWYPTLLVTSQTSEVINNVATVVAMDHQQHQVSKKDSWTVTVLRPDIHITKIGPVWANVGDVITYFVNVTNTGNCDLYNVLLYDSVVGDLPTIPFLAEGATVHLTYTYTIPAGPGNVYNTVTVTGRDITGYLVEDHASWTVQKFNMLHGFKAADLNMNGERDQNEPGLMNWVIVLSGVTVDNEPVTRTTLTNSLGYYEFSMLKAGDYQVSEVMQAGWVHISPDTYSLSLGSGNSMSLDFLNLPLGSISGAKFEDLNLNGRWDVGEPGVAGWNITLTGTDANGGSVLAVTTTDAAGHYSFTNLIPGVYYVSEESRAGWFPTTPSPLTVDVSAIQPFEITDQNFGNARYGSVTGFKWLDENMNGYQDGAEPRLPGWTIVLDGYQVDGTHVHMETVTDANGNYAFLNLKPGVYTVSEVMQPGWANITPSSREITIIEGSDVTCGKFGNVPLGSISGWKFYDWDLDQMKDGNEPGIPGWHITLTGWLSDGIPSYSQNGATPVGPITIQTDANGVWSFNNLLPGEYFVTEEQMPGWHNTTPVQLHFEIVPIWFEENGQVCLVYATHVIDVKLGNVPLTCITGTKFNDLNGNGIRDPNEPGIAGWGIDVLGGGGGGRHVVTDQDGNYQVSGLLPGIYLITEESRAGWMHTTPSEYLLDASSPRAPAHYALDFGNFLLGRITGSKWQDMNGDGILNAGDQPIQGWTIYLDKVGGGTISTTTDANGNFEFDGLTVGQYTVREESRADWVHMNQASYGVTIVSGTDVQLPPFLNVHLSTVTGCKYDDLNGNGIRDPNEPGIPGWPIYMIWDGDPTVFYTTTDAEGCYQFTGLMPDSFYEVYEGMNPDWTPTTQTWEVFSIVSGTAHQVHDFGNFHNAVITVFKFDDMNSNGVYEGLDTPLQGWHFIVSGPGILGGSAEVVTDATGFAHLTVTAAGTYTVTEIGQAGWTPTTATVQTVSVTSGSASPEVVMFGNFKCVDITLFKYEDVNSDGVYTEGVDNPIEGWTFYLTSQSGGQMTVVTDENGLAQVHLCSLDIWSVSEERRDGWIPVNPADGRASFLIISGHAYQLPTGAEQYEYDFGNFNVVHICVFKFWDKCSNGYYDPGLDTPLGNWLMVLYDGNGNLIGYGYTDQDGRLCFTVDKAGTYTVKEEDRPGWSHISPASGSWTIDVVSGDDLELDFANYEDVKVPIFKYEDRNCNGIYDQGDSPIEGWHFELVRSGDGWTFSGVTDANGMLTINVNRSGTYRLTEEMRPGWTPVNPASGTVLIAPVYSGAEVPLQMFGNFHNVLIPVFKFSDADGNGYYDPASGDSPIEGWHFYLWKEVSEGQWVLVGSNVTDVNGHTEFILTDCGHYKITEESRDGWFVISPNGGQYTFWIWSGKVFEVPFCFANFKLGTITVYKYNDLNGNGVWDQGEPGIPGWAIEILSQGPFFWYETGVTDANGTVVFTGLPPGWYTVYEDGTSSWVATAPPVVGVQVMGNTHAQVTFLNFQKGCIEGYKYNDVNGNGVYDPGIDTPIQNWEITLAITTGVTGDPPISAIAIVGTTLTDENGYYEFCDLGPGIYVVSEEQRQPWVPMTPTFEQVVMTSGATIRIHDFLNFDPGSISGYKYEDVNCNGVYDPGIDRPIEGWKVSMIEDSSPVVHVTYTNANGYWSFDNLMADYYLVWEEAKNHWTAESQNWADVTITSGLDYQVAPFLNFNNVLIPIFKFNDVNGDGIYEQGTDVPLANWSFTVTGPGLPGGSATVLTGPDGWACVEVDCSGTYTVTEADVSGWTHTTPASVSVDIKSGDVLDPLRFGNFQLGRVQGYKSYDANLNGQMDQGEMGLENWVIVLQGVLVGGGTYLQTRLTDSTGYYEFTNLLAGSYQVFEMPGPLGWVPQSPPIVNVGVTSGLAESVTFNNAVFGVIEGYKFYDKNMNGVMDGNEPGLMGWTTHLDGATDHGIPVHMTTTTDSSGHYMFADVQPGLYNVTEEMPGPEWQATTPSPQVVDSSGAMQAFDQIVNIGNVRFATIWGYKFLDTYSKGYPFWPNGVFDPDEVGIGNWQITLQGYTDTGVRVDLVTYTDNIVNIGFYEFDQVLPGTYWINETLRHGFSATTPYAVLIQVYPFPAGSVVIRRDFGNLLPSADPTMPFLLQKGWNLWSSPLMVTGLTAKGLLSAIGPNGMAVTRLDESQGRYFSYVSGYGDAYDFPIVLGHGYYVYVKQKTSFTLTGEIEQTSSTPLLKGWNIVGYDKLQPMKASELLASVSGSHAKALTYLDAATGTYHSFVKGYSAAYDFTVTQGRSYFLWVDGAGTLTV